MSIFRLQQFSIEQSLSGMKICSDSLLFGAMIPITRAKRILDIGTGTGILALMQAQKSMATADCLEHITAVELTHAAVKEAQKNVHASPWAEKISVVEQDIQGFSKQEALVQYDLIISNPPFFDRHSKTDPKQRLRHIARHTESLSYSELCQSIERLLSPAGSAYLLLPLVALADFYTVALQHKLLPLEQVNMSESKEHSAKVAMIKLQGSDDHSGVLDEALSKLKQSTIFKFSSMNKHSSEAKAFLSPFLLRFAGKDECTSA